MIEPRPSRPRLPALGLVTLLLFVGGAALASAEGPSYYNYGIYNLTVDTDYVRPGGTATVSFDYTVYHWGRQPVDCPWEIRLDGTPWTRDGDVLASGSNSHPGNGGAVTYPVSAAVAIPPGVDLGVHRLKVVTGVADWRDRRYAEVEVTVFTGGLLSWLGFDGYKQDGVNPNWGTPFSSPNPTTFVFKVAYTHPGGLPLLKANCIIQGKDCGRWKPWKALPMAWESGKPEGTGAVYRCAVQLRPNQALKYRFRFQTADGEVVGTPARYHFGPLLTGRPHLCWAGTPGFEADGVNPDSGKRGADFLFEVTYMDSWGSRPTLHQVIVRRNGKLYAQVDMTEAYGGNPQLGALYYAYVKMRAPGTYQYRFRFRDETNFANGAPCTWQAGPAITTTTTAMLPSVTALATDTGAQVTLSLSAAANVTATVVNVAARPIATIVADKPLEAGLQTLVWDRKADSGLAVPRGLYLIRVTARDADGGQSTALAAVSLR